MSNLKDRMSIFEMLFTELTFFNLFIASSQKVCQFGSKLIFYKMLLNSCFFLYCSTKLEIKPEKLMKKAIVFTFVLAVFGLYGCNSKSVSTDDVQGIDSVLDSVGVMAMDTTQDITIGSETAVTSSPVLSTPAVDPNNKGMNPAHGEPGHRCDIDVGAPLNSPPGKKSPPQPIDINTINTNPPAGSTPISPSISTTPQPAIQPQSTPVVQPGKTLPGMNPPHGESGHDCAIPVGSPLKK